MFQLIAAWLLLTEGALALIFLPILSLTPDFDVPIGDIVTFGALGVACLIAGGMLYTKFRWSVWLALIVSIASSAWLVSDKGLTSWTEAYVGVGFTVVQVVFLLLGRHAAGKPEAMALSSAHVPFRLKLTLVWIGIFFVLALFLSQVGLDWGWIRDNLRSIAKGGIYTMALALGAIVIALILALLGALGRLSKNPVAFGLSGFYTSFFRGTPLIVQLFLIYVALPQIGANLGSRALLNVLTLSAFQAGVIGLGLNYGGIHHRDLPGGYPIRGPRAGGGSRRFRHVVRAADASRGPAAGRAGHHPADGQRLHRADERHRAGGVPGFEPRAGGPVPQGADLGEQRLQALGSLDPRRRPCYWALTAIFTFFQMKLERRMSAGYVRGEVQTAMGRKRTEFLPAGPPGTVRPEVAEHDVELDLRGGNVPGHEHGSGSSG